MKNITKLSIFATLILSGQAIARDFPTTMSVPNYATARTVKVATFYDDGSTAWGTGMFVGKGKIVTENHVIADREDFGVGVSTDGEIEMEKRVRKAVGFGVLKYNSTAFMPATVTSTSPVEDLATLEIKDSVNPTVLFEPNFLRGQKVWAIGNPGWEDFSVVETKIKAIFLLPREGKPHSLIVVDDMKGKIGHGFSGGAILDSKGGVLGLIELCWDGVGLCAAISSDDVQNYLTKENK